MVEIRKKKGNFIKKITGKIIKIFKKKEKNDFLSPVDQFDMRERKEIGKKESNKSFKPYQEKQKYENLKKIRKNRKYLHGLVVKKKESYYRYKYKNKVNGDTYYKENSNPKYNKNMLKIKNIDDKYFYSRVNKQYSSNQKRLEDKLEKIKYYEEKRRGEKLKNAKPNMLYNGYHIGKIEKKKEILEGVEDEVKLDLFGQPIIVPKKKKCKYQYKIGVPNINTRYKGKIGNKKCI